MAEQLSLDFGDEDDNDYDQEDGQDSSIQDRLLTILEQLESHQIPLGDRLWTIEHVAAYMSTSTQTARRIMSKPGAPDAIRLPTRGDSKLPPRWVGSEVKLFAERQNRMKRRRIGQF